MTKKESKDKGRRSGADRRLTYLNPYVKFVYNGEDKRSEDNRREGNDRRKEPRESDT